MSVSKDDRLRIERAIRSSSSIFGTRPSHLPEPHTADCHPGLASLETEVLGPFLFVIKAVCSDCGAILDQQTISAQGALA